MKHPRTRPTASILPAFDPLHTLRDPERRLRLAVLEGAVHDFERYHRAGDARGRRLFDDAVHWFAAADRSEPFAFENVCAALGVDPDLVRRDLAHWRATELVRDMHRALGERHSMTSRRAA
jgi:hypothetical protein